MVEAMACGTPIIAYRHGSVPKVIADGVTGFIVDEVEDAVMAVARTATLCRNRCRQRFEQRFSIACMTEDHVAICRRLTDEKPACAHAG
jgi:glycosyltransferase involved in cell wall biosynthesis